MLLPLIQGKQHTPQRGDELHPTFHVKKYVHWQLFYGSGQIDFTNKVIPHALKNRTSLVVLILYRRGMNKGIEIPRSVMIFKIPKIADPPKHLLKSESVNYLTCE